MHMKSILRFGAIVSIACLWGGRAPEAQQCHVKAVHIEGKIILSYDKSLP